MTYTIFAKDKGKLNMDHCRKADAAIKSGFLETGGETVDTHESTACFHSLKWKDIKPATELLKSFGFEMMPEIYEEHYNGCICNLVEINERKCK